MKKLSPEQMDNYHLGRMSESEKTSFESTLKSDPAIKAESDFQSDVIEGLKKHRKTELKSRLNAIKIGPTWIDFVQQSTLIKSIGGIMIASLIGGGIFIYGERPELKKESLSATVKAPKVEQIELVWDLPQREEVTTIKKLEQPKEVKEVVKTTSEAEVFKPSFEIPTIELIEDDDFATTGLAEMPNSIGNSSTDTQIDVQIKKTKSSIIKYKYYDGKLFLKGDFDKAPYEILEINSTKKRRIYIYYLGAYYKAANTDKLIDLPKVQDSKVINELQLLKENK